jgi:GntR family transcriptional regulator, vanillate catabolism transcriptional regulator
MNTRRAVAPNMPVLERTRLVDEVTTHLRELILTQQIRPGAQLLQVELSESLGVSRTPLREAFRILERDGLVRISNGNRTVEVVRWSPDELRDQYEVREVVDGLAARLVARKGLSKELDRQLKRALDQMEKAVERLDHQLQLAAHSTFHAAIVEHCGNARVVALLPLIRLTSSALHPALEAAFRDGAEDQLGYLREGLDHHRAIYEALRAGDAKAAEDLARRHIRVTLKSGLIEATADATTARAE